MTSEAVLRAGHDVRLRQRAVLGMFSEHLVARAPDAPATYLQVGQPTLSAELRRRLGEGELPEGLDAWLAAGPPPVMRRSNAKAKRRRPILQLDSPLRAKVYRAKFHAYEVTRFLDEKALRRAERVTLECGTLEARGKSVPVVAEIERGEIVALKPVACEGCEPRRGRKLGKSNLRRVQRLITRQLEAGGFIKPSEPQPIRISRKIGLRLPFDSHVIDIHGDFICIVVIVGNSACWYCIGRPPECIDMGPFPTDPDPVREGHRRRGR